MASEEEINTKRASIFKNTILLLNQYKLNDKVSKNQLNDSENIYVVKPRKNKCVIWSLLFTAVLCVSVSVFMASTSLIRGILSRDVMLRNNTFRYEMWREAPVEANLRVYIFNYTNVADFENGLSHTLKVSQLGPYTYREKIKKINITFNDNGTVSYREKKTYTFVPELSNGTPADEVIVPNIPLMGAVSMVKSRGFLEKLVISQFLRSLNANPFVRVNASALIWGYEDNLFKLAKGVIQFQYDIPFDNFGLMAGKNGTLKDINTIYTGSSDKWKIGMFSNFKGQSNVVNWGTAECNKIDGSDGSMFPPLTVSKSSTLSVYNRDMCRKFSLVYEKDVYSPDGIYANRFNFSKDVFQYPQESCYCAGDVCPPNGVFNASSCLFGTPIFISQPHFLGGDDILFEYIDGLQPDYENHGSYVDLHPYLGLPLGGKSRLQINIMVERTTAITQTSSFEDKTILPVSWMELSIDTLTDELVPFMSLVSHGLNFLDFFITYGLIIIATICIVFILKQVFKQNKLNDTSNLSLIYIQSEKL